MLAMKPARIAKGKKKTGTYCTMVFTPPPDTEFPSIKPMVLPKIEEQKTTSASLQNMSETGCMCRKMNDWVTITYHGNVKQQRRQHEGHVDADLGHEVGQRIIETCSDFFEDDLALQLHFESAVAQIRHVVVRDDKEKRSYSVPTEKNNIRISDGVVSGQICVNAASKKQGKQALYIENHEGF